ncbi:hypothetical protein G5576_006151 [Homo sapiens]|uniref:Leucine rich transmembrane and O-methyltransferase domain containing n=2 Tax=Homo sapiens TaxID=9606 RepID=A0A2R8Y5Q9_HUMAN|nr:hypothetical protein KI723_111323 [Homo sapiens]KAI4072911.1 hypothetical protein G5576_006151 [Homo sapiens]
MEEEKGYSRPWTPRPVLCSGPPAQPPRLPVRAADRGAGLQLRAHPCPAR